MTTTAPAVVSTPTTAPAPTSTTTPATLTTAIEATGSAAIGTDDLATLRARVLAAIPLRWESLLAGWTIRFNGPRKGYRGSTFPKDKRIEIYIRAGEQIDELIHITAHEMGHAIDVTYLDDAERNQFAVARGRSGGSSWWVASGADDFASGAGDWAESFAWMQMAHGPWFSRLGPPPSPAQLSVMRTFFP